MNILFVTDLYPLFVGEKGVPTALCDFVEAWLKAGHKVTVFRPNFLPSTLLRKRKICRQGEYDRCGVKIYNKNYIFPKLLNLKGVPEGKYDVVVAHMPAGLLYGAQIAEKLSLPLVCGVHATDIKVLKGYMYFREKSKKAYHMAYAIAARSPWLLDEIKKIIPEVSEKVFLANSGVDKKYIVEPLPKQKIEKFITVSQFIKRKNIDRLIKAFKDIQGPWSLEIIGTGPKERELKKLVKSLGFDERVHFAGSLPHNEVMKRMQGSDVFILPSDMETFGLVYLEAMASGCITVCTENSGAAGIIKDDINGFLCGTSVQGIKETIERVRACKDIGTILQNAHNDISVLTKETAAENYIKHIAR